MVGLLRHMFLIPLAPYFTLTMTDLPVFEPNDYFWEHHWNEGQEEKWEAFANAVRKIIVRYHGDLKLSDQTMEDKFALK